MKFSTMFNKAKRRVSDWALYRVANVHWAFVKPSLFSKALKPYTYSYTVKTQGQSPDISYAHSRHLGTMRMASISNEGRLLS